MQTYKPRRAPRMRPGQKPEDALNELADFLETELRSIQKAAGTGNDAIYNNVLHVEPTKMYPGMEVIADGTDFNPSSLGTGEGKYRRNSSNTLWIFVG